VDYTDLDRAAYDAAVIENRATFHGYPINLSRVLAVGNPRR
jgi:hypothetical protein